MGKVTFGPETRIVLTNPVPELGASIISNQRLREISGEYRAMSGKAVLLDNMRIDAFSNTDDPVSRWVPFSHVMFCDPVVERMARNEIKIGEAVSLMVSDWIYTKIMQDVRQEWARRRAGEYDGEKAAVTAREVREAAAASRLNRQYAEKKDWFENERRAVEEQMRAREDAEQKRLEWELLQRQRERTVNRQFGITKEESKRRREKAKEPAIDFASTPKRKFNFDE
jgi:hypothetical protein